MAYLRSELASPGIEIEIDVRGRHRSARVEERPLYRRAD
jgi:glycine cleavage system aminomethyltransferase T